jgi:S-layer protein (TIGR01567 family)
MNFEGFYYNIDEDLGTERLEVKNTGTSIDDGNIVYTTTIQSVRFDYSGWCEYNVIGFMAEKCFAGYNSGTDKDITDDAISLVSHNLLSKVLIDSDRKLIFSTGASLELEEGYELKIIQLDVSGGKAEIELIRNGKSVDTSLIGNTPATYTYARDLGAVDDVPLIAIRVDSVFAGTESDMLVIKGIFQISEDYISIKTGDRYGEMEITSTSSTGITMKNPDDIDLNEGGNTIIMGDIGFMTSDDGDRYCPFVRRTVGPIAALKIELPESLIVGEESVITVTSYGTPVEGAHVRFAGGNLGPTDSNGEVRFTPDTAGMFMITAIKENYDFAYIAVRIVGGSAATADAVIALQLAVSGGWDDEVDVSGDGKITSLDALMILQRAAGVGTPPKIALVDDSISINNSIIVSFDKPIDISTLSMSLIGPYCGIVQGHIICDDDMKGALFDPDNPLQIGEHRIRVKCRDLSDNLAEQEFVLTVVSEGEPDPNTTTEIMINELMPNPIGTDRGNETTELYNCGDELVDIGGWVLKNVDGVTYNIPAGTTIEPYGYYLTTEVQLDNSDGQVLLYRDGEEVDSSIEYTHSTEGISWQRRIDGLDTDSDGDWIERDSTFGVPG